MQTINFRAVVKAFADGQEVRVALGDAYIEFDVANYRNPTEAALDVVDCFHRADQYEMEGRVRVCL